MTPNRGTPVLSIAIAPNTEAARERLDHGLQHLLAEDTNLSVQIDHAGDAIIAGVGELHLEIVANRLRREFNVDATFSKPQVLFKVALTRRADGEMKFARQTGGRGQYGHVKIHLSPGAPGTGYVFCSDVAGSIPKEFIEPVNEGIRETLAHGVLGYPIVDVRVELYDGSYHDVDSSAAAFRRAGAMALQDAAKKAEPILLEPVMRVSVVGPTVDMAGVAENLAGRRGEIEAQEDHGPTTIIRACVPISEMLGYAVDLRSRTDGRATYSLTFDRYEPFRGHTGDDRSSFVRAPRKPAPRVRNSALAVPEPDDERFDPR
jgi:elongation factor G